MNILNIQAGDVVREVATARERVVVSFRSDIGMIEFEDSHLQGWTPAEGWIPTGVRVEPTE
jgi:hypothetical protein